ncbi:MAG: hypothetical protein KA270_08000 [Saprospiraceae bacterium]|jgi:hypothetical protein|nr:hypothetical protein [Saprospiraceae bacterium]MBP6567094.1 hypothetical protein [Saprospiraceae bacterium]
MNTKSLIAWIAGFVTLMLTGFLFYEVLLKSYFAKLMENEGDCFLKEPPILPMIIAHLCFAAILLIILRNNNVNTLMGGVKSTLILVVLVFVWYDAWAFTYLPQMTLQTAAVDVTVNSICTLLSAGVMGWVLGQFK